MSCKVFAGNGSLDSRDARALCPVEGIMGHFLWEAHPLFLEDTLLLVRTYDRTKFSDVAVLFLSSLLRKFKELIVVGNTAKPPISNHPKWEELMVAYGR